jgi:hypothetical protein
MFDAREYSRYSACLRKFWHCSRRATCELYWLAGWPPQFTDPHALPTTLICVTTLRRTTSIVSLGGYSSWLTSACAGRISTRTRCQRLGSFIWQRYDSALLLITANAVSYVTKPLRGCLAQLCVLNLSLCSRTNRKVTPEISALPEKLRFLFRARSGIVVSRRRPQQRWCVMHFTSYTCWRGLRSSQRLARESSTRSRSLAQLQHTELRHIATVLWRHSAEHTRCSVRGRRANVCIVKLKRRQQNVLIDGVTHGESALR